MPYSKLYTMNKKIILIAILLLQIFTFQLHAQDRGSKVESIKIAFLSERLNLDPKTAEKFWPIYNQYDDEMRKVVQESKRSNDNRTAEEILDQEQKAIDIKRKYSAIFLKVISNEQLTSLFQAEKEFNKMLLRRMNKAEQRQQNHGGPNQQSDDRRMNSPRNQDNMENRPSNRQPRSDAQPNDGSMRRGR